MIPARSLGRQRAYDIPPTNNGDTITIHNHMTRDGDDPEPPWFANHKKDTDARFKLVHDALHEIGYALRGYFAEGPGGSKVSGQVTGADDEGEEEGPDLGNRIGTGAPRNVPANSAEARGPLWRSNAHEMLTETSGRALDRSTLRTPADINRRAQELKMRGNPHYRPTW